MKLTVISTTVFLIFIAPVFSELTVKDLEKIRSIVKESEGHVKEHVDLKIKNVSDKIEEMDKRLNQTFNLVLALIALIIFAIGIPQIVIAWQGKQQKEQAQRIEQMQQEIEVLKTNSVMGM